jgi:hypothetical protein
VLAFLNAITKYGVFKSNPGNGAKNACWHFLTISLRLMFPSDAAKKYLDDISEHMQKYSASTWVYHCCILPGSIRVLFIYIFPKEGMV